MSVINEIGKTLKLPKEENAFDKDLKELLKDIQYQTGYMTGSWGDTSMLSQMAIEDGISPWSIESEVEKFAKKYNIKL
tara:strand:- start:136 stop:369 length:234 start_codon:yes stop_codon:yes gene_type:complete